MDIDYSIFKNLACYEEFEIKSSLYGIDKKEILENLINDRNLYENKIYLVLGGHLVWFDLNTGEKIDTPDVINGFFNCGYNQLTSLEGCPKIINGNFYCNDNQLTSLKYCPVKVKKGFNCSHNRLISLKGCQEKINGYFNCSHNQLTSLEGCPVKVNGYFNCLYNKLKNLDDLTTKIKGKIYSDFD